MTAARAASVSGRDPVISVPNESGETGKFFGASDSICPTGQGKLSG